MHFLDRIIDALKEVEALRIRSYIQPEDPVMFFLEKGLGIPVGQVEEVYMLMTRVKGTALVVWNLQGTGRAQVQSVDYTRTLTPSNIYIYTLNISMSVQYSVLSPSRYVKAFMDYLRHMLIFHNLTLNIEEFVWDIGTAFYQQGLLLEHAQYLFMIAQ